MTKLQMPSDSEAYFYFRTGDYPILHSHDGYWEFIYVTSGEYTHEINKELRVIKAGTLCVLRPDDAHCTRENTKRSTYITFCVKDEYFLTFSPQVRYPICSRSTISKFAYPRRTKSTLNPFWTTTSYPPTTEHTPPLAICFCLLLSTK